MTFSANLQQKIDQLNTARTPLKLGSVHFESPLLLAPMASICNYPFRVLMEKLGAGGTVSELISSHAIKYGNERTLNMLRIHKDEVNVGIQIFGEEAEDMAYAARVSEEYNPKFIDINMGCPVRKVVTKGGGSALLKDPAALAPFLRRIKKEMTVPLTIKIRMGWDADGINADEIIKVAHDEGVEFVAIHGRTRAQQYTGTANWDYIEKLAVESPLPLIGNGDLHNPEKVRARMAITNCPAVMIARGALRNPFIFLESLADRDDRPKFYGEDYWEIIKELHRYTCEAFDKERIRVVQLRKLIVWFASGFPNAAKFRSMIFKCNELADCMKITEDYYCGLGTSQKQIDFDETFMNSGHG